MRTSAPSESAAYSTRYPDVDLIIVRETRRVYILDWSTKWAGVVESLKIITEKASTRIAKFAFEYARKNQRKKFTRSIKPIS